MSAISFRPHHFLCALSFQGKGYSPEFVANFAAIMQRLNAVDGDEIEITVSGHTDSICEPCPSRRDQLCETQEKITRLDNAHAEILQLSAGEKLTWGDAKQRIADYMTLPDFQRACDGCSWKSFGICENVLNTFRQQQTLNAATTP